MMTDITISSRGLFTVTPLGMLGLLLIMEAPVPLVV